MKRSSYYNRRGTFSQKKNSDFFHLAQWQIDMMRLERQPKTVYNCQTALRALQRYLHAAHPEQNVRLPLRCITPELMEGFHRFHLRRGVSDNTIREYLCSLRSLVNRCVRSGYPLRHDIFSRVHTSTLPTHRQALSERDMRRFYGAMVHQGSRDALVRDCALFSYLTGGMPFADLARLKDSNYNPQTNELTYRRHKTGVTVRVQLTKEALKIWQRHAKTKDGLLQGTPGKDGLDSAAKSQGGGRPESLYHFGWLESADPVQADKEYHNALARYNRGLCRLTASCGVKTSVTSYTLRHTFASVARNEYNADMHVISVPLGHRSERTTAIYISRIDSGQVYALQQKMERGLLR